LGSVDSVPVPGFNRLIDQMVRMISNKSAAFGAAPVVACSVMHCLRLNSRHGDRLWSSETLNGRDAESARARCDGDAANERLMTADRRAIRAVADDGYEPFRKGQREIRKN
jgi:hypothetical protein